MKSLYIPMLLLLLAAPRLNAQNAVSSTLPGNIQQAGSDFNPFSFKQQKHLAAASAQGTGVGCSTYQYLVTLTTDENDGNFAANDLSLREAVLLSNSDGCASEIYFDQTVFAGPQTITLLPALGHLTVTLDGYLDIYGAGEKLLTVSGNNLTRIFNVAANADFYAEEMTLANGRSGSNSSGQGGAIRNNGFVSLADITIRNCAAAGGSGVNANTGGAVYNAGTGTTDSYFERCTFRQNSATASGGAIFNLETSGNSSSIFLLDCSFISNSSASTGGAIQTTGGAYTEMLDMLFQGNTAANGGALHCSSASSAVNVANATFTGNSATAQGGAVRCQSGNVWLTHCTINANTAPGTGGGGVMGLAGSTALRNCIIIGNTAANTGGTAFVSGGTNLVGTTTAAFWVGTDIVNSPSAKLGPLGTYGGNTMCLPVMSGSPAIDAASDCNLNACPPFVNTYLTYLFMYDQRYTARPFDEPTVSPATSSDIGSFERTDATASCTYLLDGQVDIAYTQTITPNSGTFSYAVTSGTIPPGLVLSGITGGAYTISGIPTAFGNYSFVVTVTGSGASSGQTLEIPYCIYIYPGARPSITTSPITLGQGQTAASSTVANVYDSQSSVCSLLVASIAPSTGTGVTLSNIVVACDGSVTATVAATCVATNSTFTLQVTDTDNNTSTATLNVTVSPQLIVYSVTGGGPFCQPTSATIGLNSSQTGISYQLYRDDIAVGGLLPGTNASPVSFATQTAAGVYTVVASNAYGCTKAMVGNVTIKPIPTYGAISASDGCEGQEITMYLNGLVEGQQVVTYTIDAGTPQNLTIDVSDTGTYEFNIPAQDDGTQVVIQSLSTVGSPVCSTPVNITLTLDVYPVADDNNLAILVTQDAVCPGENINIDFSGMADGSYLVTYTLYSSVDLPVTTTETLTFFGGETSLGLIAPPAADYTFVVDHIGYFPTDCGQDPVDVEVVFSTKDTEMPEAVMCPEGASTLSLDANCAVTIPDLVGSVSYTDNCTAELTISQEPLGLSLFESSHGEIVTVTVFATDESENVNSDCQISYLIVDETAPTLNCPTDISLATNEGQCTVSIEDWSVHGVTFSDNCSELIPVFSNDGPFAPGTETITVVVVDDAGNTNECAFDLTVTENEDPYFVICPAGLTIELEADIECDVILGDLTTLVDATDGCSPNDVELFQSPDMFTLISEHGTEQVITITAEDASGNTAACEFTVIVKDLTAPSVTCPDDLTVEVDDFCEYTIEEFSPFDLSDNCTLSSSIVITQDPVACDIFQKTQEDCTTISLDGTQQTITLYATDEAGNTGSCVFVITLEDVTAPTISNCPLDITVDADANCSGTVGDWTTLDLINDLGIIENCDFAVSQSPSATTLLGFDDPTPVTLTVTDDAGNTSIPCIFEITLEDNTGPTLTCPQTVTVTASGTCIGTLGTYLPVSSVDNCSGTVTFVSQSPVSGSTFSGSQVVTLTSEDISENAGTCTFTVVASDNMPPNISVCPSSQNVNLNANCQIAVPDLVSVLVASDNCALNTTTQSPTAGSLISKAHNGTQVVTFTVRDVAGNSATCSATLTAKDITLPNLTCPANATVNASALGCVANVGTRTALSVSDNCGGVIGVVQSPLASATFTGTQVVTLTATDLAGNTNTCSLTLTKVDITAPVVSGCPSTSTININVDGSCNAAVPNFLASPYTFTATDACAGTLTLTQISSAGAIIEPAEVTSTVTLVATDDSGNSNTSCSFTVRAIDNVAPSIACPANTSVTPGANCIGTVGTISGFTATDNCTPSSSIIVTQSPAATATFTGSQIVTLTATDASSLTHSCTFTLTVQDATPPSITCPSSVNIPTAANNCTGALGTYTATVSDNCTSTGSIVVVQAPLSGTALAVNVAQTVTLTATDAAGLSNSCTFTVTLRDNTAPVLGACPPNTTLAANASCQSTVGAYSVTATDNCAGTLSSTQSPVASTVITGHNTAQVITLSATDGNGNTSTCSFTVTLKDVTVPTIAGCPANTTVSVNALCQFTVPNLLSGFSATDNCAGSTAIAISQSPVAGTTATGTTSVQLRAFDGNGNTNTACVVTLTANDITPPTAVCKPTYTLVLSSATGGTTTVTASALNNGSSDNCGPLTFSIVESAVFACGATPRVLTLRVTDGALLTSTCTSTVSVADQTAPTVTCKPATINVSSTLTTGAVTLSSADNCGVTSSTVTPNTFTCANLGANTVTLRVFDAAGLSGSCTAVVTVTSSTPPTAICRTGVQTFNLSAGNTIPVALVNNGSFAACGSITMAITTPINGNVTCANLGNNTVRLTVTDGSGNTASCSSIVKVVDNILPVANCQSISVALPASGIRTITALQVNNGSTDNCTISNFVVTPATFTCANLGANTVTLKVTDNSGNTKTCAATVTVTQGAANCFGGGGEDQLVDYNESTDETTTDDIEKAAFNETTVNSEVQSMVLSPNPTKGMVNIAVAGFEGKAVKLCLYDELGRLVICQNLLEASDNAVVTWNMTEQNVRNGIFTVVLRSEDVTIAKRLVYVQ